jgi:hypothetical protein
MDKIILPCFALIFSLTYFHMAGQPTPIQNPPSSLGLGPALVYFGTKDCPACRSFVQGGGLAEMEKFARANRIPMVSREIGSLGNLGKPGAFAEFDGVWSATRSRTGNNAVPSFALVKANGVVHATTGEWQLILRNVKDQI